MKKKLLLSAITTILLVMTMEAITRYGLGKCYGPTFQTYLTFDRSKGWKPCPNGNYLVTSKAKGFTFNISMDSSGYRLDEGMKGCTNQEPAIIILGDSYAFGFALNPDKTLSASLAHYLRERGLEGKGVLNAGCSGYDIVQSIMRARDRNFVRGQMYVFLVHPVNDLVNTANCIDYHAYKPFIITTDGPIKIVPPTMGKPKTNYLFSPDFSELNARFGLSKEKSTVLDYACNVSTLAFTLRCSRSLAWFGHHAQPQQILWDDMSSGAFSNQTMFAISNDPLKAACRFWPEIRQCTDESSELVAHVGCLYAEIKALLASEGCTMCVVLAPEPNRNTAFHRSITDLIQSLLPQFTFDWGSSARALKEELQGKHIPVICPEYDQTKMEAMFVPLDGHTSSEACRIIAAEIADVYPGRLSDRNFPGCEGLNN